MTGEEEGDEGWDKISEIFGFFAKFIPFGRFFCGFLILFLLNEHKKND